MYALPDLFVAPCVGPNHWSDIALPVTHQFAGPVIYYDGLPARVEFVQMALVTAGVPNSQSRAFLSSAEPAPPGTHLGLLSDIGHAVARAIGGAVGTQPRDGHGRWVGGTGSPTVAPAPAAGADLLPLDHPHVQRAAKMIERSIKKSQIGEACANDYRADAMSVIRAMTPKTLKRFNENVRAVHFARTFDGVSKAIRTRLGRLGDATPVPDGVAGAYIKAERALVLDGGVPGTRPEEGVHGAGVFAHEAGHGVDGPNDEISRSNDWLAAWAADILRSEHAPSAYSKHSPAEGLAEFHRALTANRAAATKLYPRCVRVWADRGIL